MSYEQVIMNVILDYQSNKTISLQISIRNCQDDSKTRDNVPCIFNDKSA